MKIKELNLSVTRFVKLSDDFSEKITLEYKTEINSEQEDPTEVFGNISKLIDQQLNAWERELRKKTDREMVFSKTPPPVTSAADLIQPAVATQQTPKSKEEVLICPICKVPMHKKEGKNYYLCEKHYGYPDMIKRGEVRERKF